MRGLKLTIGTLLGIASVWLVLNGASIVVQTMGRVSGSEFGMLITLASLAANIVLWLGLYGLWFLIPSGPGAAEMTTEGNK
jgi:hypothetical protein